MTSSVLYQLPRKAAFLLLLCGFGAGDLAAQQGEVIATPPSMESVEQAWSEGDFATAREGLEILATQDGTALAQFRYGRILVEGRGGPRDIEGGISWLHKAVDQNDVDAMTLLARIYLSDLLQDANSDDATQANWERGEQLLTRAAELGHAEGQYHLAMLYQSGSGVPQDHEAAVKWFLAAAKQGYVSAKYELSVAFSRGEGVEQSNEEALRWLTEAAEDGHLNSQYFLAVSYEDGRGVEQDIDAALRWYRRAAEGGMITAQRNLGTLYLQGQGVEQNAEEGLRWLTGAAGAGDSGAMFNLGAAYEFGLGIEDDIGQAVDWYGRASANGLGRGMVALGRLYEEGRGVEASMDQALNLYFQALQTGDQTLAVTRLGQLAIAGMLDGKVAPHNAVPWVLNVALKGDAEAEKWLITQAETGVRPAITALAALFLAQEERLEDGVLWLERAAIAGDAAAQAQLGEMHLTGTIVAVDAIAAHKWLNIAATLGQSAAADLRDTLTARMTPEQLAEAQAQARHWFENEQPQPPATDQAIKVVE